MMAQRDIAVQPDETEVTAALRVVTTLAGGVVTHTTDGVHSDGSYHYAGQAVDVALPSGPSWDSPELGRVAAELLRLIPIRFIKEFIWAGPNPVYIKNGRRVAPYASAQHHDHIHLAVSAAFTYQGTQEITVPNDPNLPDITGPVQLDVLFNSTGECTGYFIFSHSTGELHGFGPGAKFHGRSEVVKLIAPPAA